MATYASWDEFLAQNALDLDAAHEAKRPQVHLLTKQGARTYADSAYRDGDWLIFGKESSGLDATLLLTHPELCERIPMRTEARSLNLANSVAITVYEALRQLDYPGLQGQGKMAD